MTEFLSSLCCLLVLSLEGVGVAGDGERKSNVLEDDRAVKADKFCSILVFSITMVLLKMSSPSCCISSSKMEVSRLEMSIPLYLAVMSYARSITRDSSRKMSISGYFSRKPVKKGCRFGNKWSLIGTLFRKLGYYWCI